MGIKDLSSACGRKLRTVCGKKLFNTIRCLFQMFPGIVLSTTLVFKLPQFRQKCRHLVYLNESRGEDNYALWSRQTVAIQNREL